MNNVYNLTGSWEAYNERKSRNGQDPNCFSPEELWEFDYLVNLITQEKPHIDPLMVMLAVREGMRRTMAPRPRQHFVEIVLSNIVEREHRWSNLLNTYSIGS